MSKKRASRIIKGTFTIEECLLNVGKKVSKTSKPPKPFLSGLRFNTIKSVINHPILNVPAYTFNEDDSFVEVRRCIIVDDAKAIY